MNNTPEIKMKGESKLKINLIEYKLFVEEIENYYVLFTCHYVFLFCFFLFFFNFFNLLKFEKNCKLFFFHY